MIEHSSEITELSKALNIAQAELTGVAKDSKNPHFKNRYASLEAVIDTAKPALNKNGITFTQAPGALVDGAVEITTMLMHTSGQWLRSTLHMPVVKRDPQGVGSAITYGLRYSLMAVLGVPPTDDDDGERAMDRNPPQQRQQATKVGAADIIAEFRKASSVESLKGMYSTSKQYIDLMNEKAVDEVRQAYAERLQALREAA